MTTAMKQYRIAVAGCGGMAKTWIKSALARTDAAIVALVDINEKNAKELAKQFNLKCSVYADIGAAITREQANLVFDVTIPRAHKAIVTTALNLGANVFGEKPMAFSLAEAEEMVAAAGKTGRMYAVMQNRRYMKNIRAFRELVASGIIGKPGLICADFFIGAHFGSFRDAMESPLLLDMAIHTFDQARFILGNANPVSVYCHEFNPKGSWYAGNAAAACIFEFADGSVFSYRGSWCSEGCNTSWESAWRITGAKGSAIWDGEAEVYAEIARTSTSQKLISEIEHVNGNLAWNGREGHAGCLDEMFAALSENRKAETDCEDNIQSMKMVFGAIESSKKEKKILLR